MTKGNKTSNARETVYDRCAYVGCYNGKFINGRRLFHFPSETDRRLEMWIERSGNFRLRTWAATSLRKAGLCGDHFDDKCFTNATRKALRRNVVPRHYTEDRKFRKANGDSAAVNNENNENNRNPSTEEDEDDPLSYERTSTIRTESAAQARTNGEASQSAELAVNEVSTKIEIERSPSPVVEFIVEELDESLIYEDSCKPEDSYSPAERDSSLGEPTFEYEEQNLQTDNEESREESPTVTEEARESTGAPDENGLRVNRSDSDVRTYVRSKSHGQPKLELASGESEALTDEETSANPASHACVESNTVKRREKSLHTLQEENKELRKTMRVLKQKLRRAKARESNYTRIRDMLKNVDEFLDVQECTNPVARAMVKLALHKRNVPYSREEKELATQLYRHTSTAFVRLRRAGCNFPGQSTMRRWLAEENSEMSNCDLTLATEANDEDDEIEAEVGLEEVEEMVAGPEDVGEQMEEAFDDAEDAIDELVEHIEEQIEDAVVGHEVYVEEIPPDEEDEVDFK